MQKYKVVSDSMLPLIPIGSELLIENYNDKDVMKKFDIIVFKVSNQLMCHYFWHENLYLDKGLIITRALKTGDKDIPFEKSNVVGVVTNFKISNWMKLKIILSDLFK